MAWQLATGRGVLQGGELLLQTVQRSQHRLVRRITLTTEFAIFFGSGDDLIHSSADIIDRLLIGLGRVCGGRLDHGLNASGDNHQLFKQGFEGRCSGFIHWGFALCLR